MKPTRNPPRDLVSRIVREEARAAGVAYLSVLGRGGKGKIRIARQRAICRIVEETGCSQRGLSNIWGIASRTVLNARRAIPAPPTPYDDSTLARLSWAHGPDRAKAIVEGRDFGTQQDIATWRNLGRGRGA